ncbi:MAG: prolyl oligopeptidase family serine peptidase [Candidatus Saccharibacteria bacterium]
MVFKNKPPATKKVSTIENFHGYKIADDYRWLEDNKNHDKKIWINQQNKYTDSILKKQPNFNIWKQKIEPYIRTEMHSMPVNKNGVIFFRCQFPNDDFPSLIVDNGSKEKVLLDLAEIGGGESIELSFWSPSHDGNLLVYGIAKKGNEIPTLKVRNVNTRKDIDVEIINANGNINWLDDNSGFFYTRGPKPNTVSENDVRMHTKLYLHKLGDNFDGDELIFGKDRPADDKIIIDRRFGAPYLAISVSKAWSVNDVYLFDIKSGKINELFIDKNAQFDVVPLPDKLVVGTNLNAPNVKIIVIPNNDINNTAKQYKELISESNMLIVSFSITKSRIFVSYLHDASTKVDIFDHDGNKKGKLPAPDIANIYLKTSSTDDEIYYRVETMVQPGIIYKMNTISLDSKVYFVIKINHNPDDYIIKREWAKSKDKTKLPIFIVYKKGLKLNGKNPTILYGYGGFNNIISPYYMYTNMAWLESGGVYVLSVLRGGGEYGEKWHQDGILDKKQNTFDDFIACAEYLQMKNYTDKEHLAIIGGSNGGLLVGAVTMQRPDLFKTVVCAVPLLDMIHYHKLLIASRWMNEYGDPDNIQDFNYIIKWSPYHNVDNAIDYPSIYFITSENDTRVHPMHTYKMTAKLQNVDNPNIVLMRLERNTGHSGSKPRSMMIDSISEKLTFIAWQLGLKV